MRAGKLDKQVLIKREATTLDAFGAPSGTLSTLHTLRAQIITASTDEAIKSYGESTEVLTVFRTRFRNDILLSDVVEYDGRQHNLIEIKEIGRRKGLELRTIARGEVS